MDCTLCYWEACLVFTSTGGKTNPSWRHQRCQSAARCPNAFSVSCRLCDTPQHGCVYGMVTHVMLMILASFSVVSPTVRAHPI
jgi:hypothetical protein